MIDLFSDDVNDFEINIYNFDNEEAIRALGSEMLILDLTMPRLDGEQAFRELRLIDPQVNVIMSSGYNEQEVTQRFIGKRLAGFIQKPYNLAALKQVIGNTSPSFCTPLAR